MNIFLFYKAISECQESIYLENNPAKSRATIKAWQKAPLFSNSSILLKFISRSN